MDSVPKKQEARNLELIDRSLGDSSKSSLRYNFIDLNPQLISDHPQFKYFLDYVFSEMKSQGWGYPQREYNYHLRDHLRLVLLNLALAYFSDPEKAIRYFRDKNRYAKGTVLHKLYIKHSYLVGRVIPYLKSQGYIEDWKGQYFKDSKYASRMRATPKLILLAQKQHKVTLPMIRRNLPEKNLVILRDENKNEIDYEDTPDTLRMKENLKLINQVLDKNVILLGITNQDLAYLNKRLNSHKDEEVRKGGSIDFTQTSLWRVFNNSSWRQGGRFYGGWWQRIIHNERRNENYRMHITINGLPTWESDYSGLHINMLYALEKLPLPKGDVYYLPGFPKNMIFRNFVERMLLVMVNASSRSIVRQVLHEEVYKKKSLELPKDIKSTRGVDIFPVMDAFEREHAPIRKYFCTGEGVNLQYHDSVIAEAILVFFAKNNIPCLPVHDSFIVDFRYREMLELAMQEAFLKYFEQQATVTPKKFIGFEIVKKTILEINKRQSRFKEKMSKKEDKNIDRDYTQYEKMLKEFAEIKGATIGKYKIRTKTFEEFFDVETCLVARHEELLKLFDKIKKQFPNVPVQ